MSFAPSVAGKPIFVGYYGWGIVMFRCVVLACAGTVALSLAAHAADIYVPTPVSPGGYKDPPWYPTWTGFYVGVNGGYGWGRADDTSSLIAVDTIGGVGSPFTINASETARVKFDGALGGAQIGGNIQTGRFVFGFEADFDATDQKGNSSTVIPIPALGSPASITETHTEKLEWLSTIRGRLGYSFNNVLFYATGGIAFAGLNSSDNVVVESCHFGPPCSIGNFNQTETKTGWVVGGGGEYAIDPHWSLKIEYLHADLGRERTDFATAGGCFGNSGSCRFYNPGTASLVTKNITDDIVRAGVNYHFGSEYVPLK